MGFSGIRRSLSLPQGRTTPTPPDPPPAFPDNILTCLYGVNSSPGIWGYMFLILNHYRCAEGSEENTVNSRTVLRALIVRRQDRSPPLTSGGVCIP